MYEVGYQSKCQARYQPEGRGHRAAEMAVHMLIHDTKVDDQPMSPRDCGFLTPI